MEITLWSDKKQDKAQQSLGVLDTASFLSADVGP